MEGTVVVKYCRLRHPSKELMCTNGDRLSKALDVTSLVSLGVSQEELVTRRTLPIPVLGSYAQAWVRSTLLSSLGASERLEQVTHCMD